MKKYITVYLAGIITAAVILSATPVFAETGKTIDAVFGLVKLVVNGKPVDKETLAYNGTTYVPLRAAAEIFGLEVNYDDKTKTAYLGAAPVASGGNTLTVDGDFKVTYKSFSLVKDYKGNDAIMITYDFTNLNPEEAQSFMIAVGDRLYQDGIQLEMAVTGESENTMTSVKNGATVTVKTAYLLRNTQSPIEIELKELFSFSSNNKVTINVAIK